MDKANSDRDSLLTLLNGDLHFSGELRESEALDYFRSVALAVSKIVHESVASSGIAFYSTGIESGKYVRLASLGEKVGEQEYETNSNKAFIRAISELSLNRFEGLRKSNQFVSTEEDIAAFYVFGRGEIFGFLLIRGASDASKTFFENHYALINAILSDQAFSQRMSVLSEPLSDPTILSNFEQNFAGHVANLVTRGFGADGCTFRLRNDGKFRIVGTAGQVTPEVVKAREVGQIMSNLLLESPDFDWAAVILDREDSLDIGGFLVPNDLKAILRSTGLYSVLMCKLLSTSEKAYSDGLGTLSYYFLRPTAYSRRDVALFRSFAQKVSAYLTMHFAFDEIRQQKHIVELQSRYMMHSEVASLLAHDLWHKANTVAYDSETALDMFRSGLDRGRITGKDQQLLDLGDKLDKLNLAANALHETASKYKNLQVRGDGQLYEKKAFSVSEAIDSVESTLASVLDRRGIQIRRRLSSTLIVFGPKFLFEQVLYNLFINSIDAISTFGAKRRDNWIEVHGRSDHTSILLRISDSGPGVSYQHFPDIQSVFEIGRTSKEDGSGTGLTTARQVLGTHFGGDLTLNGRRPPVFTIVVPAAL